MSVLAHKICRPLSSPALLHKFTNHSREHNGMCFVFVLFFLTTNGRRQPVGCYATIKDGRGTELQTTEK